jgi:alanine racemase
VSDSPAVRHSSVIELSQSALRKNLGFVRETVGAHPVISMVVKANAYGHDIKHVVPMAERCGIRHFSVASSYEAQGVLEARQEDSSIMIMGILYDQDLDWVIENDIEFFVFDLERLEKAAEVARALGRPARVHLEVETGGHRTGLNPEDLGAALALLRKGKKHLEFKGLCTHLAGAETLANQFRIVKQIEAFEALRKKIRRNSTVPERFHVASSAAALGMPETAMDMVRVGTAAYGLWPSPDIHNLHLLRVNKTHDSPLHRILTWKTNVMHLKDVPRDQFVGYGTSFQTRRDTRVGVLPIGYANGYPRGMSNRGHVLIEGKKAPVIGAVNMNMFLVDCTEIPGAEVGSEVVLVGRQKSQSISLRSFSEFTSALNTEFVSRLPEAIPRQVVR